jgi:hypothetical protein
VKVDRAFTEANYRRPWFERFYDSCCSDLSGKNTTGIEDR